MSDLYNILQVPPSATQNDIKKAFRNLALTHHPDKGGDPEMFRKISGAYEVLSNPEKRAIYDTRGATGLKESGEIPEDLFSAMFSNLGNLSGLGNLGNIFQLFRNATRKATPIIYNLHVSLEDLCTRKVTKLKLARTVPCDCNKAISCTDCEGSGVKIVTEQYRNMVKRTQTQCGSCSGRGIRGSCEKCDNGSVLENSILEINLLPSMETGYRFPNAGNIVKGYETGDFVAIIHRIEHPVFKVRGNDLIYTKKITLKEALLGHTFDIPHPSGELISISNSEITDPETVQVIPKGLVENSILEIHYKIIFPKKLSETQKQLLLNF